MSGLKPALLLLSLQLLSGNSLSSSSPERARFLIPLLIPAACQRVPNLGGPCSDSSSLPLFSAWTTFVLAGTQSSLHVHGPLTAQCAEEGCRTSVASALLRLSEKLMVLGVDGREPAGLCASRSAFTLPPAASAAVHPRQGTHPEPILLAQPTSLGRGPSYR